MAGSTADSDAAARIHPALGAFTAPTAQWFASTFAAPTQCQVSGWEAIAQGRHCLIAAPTGSGKTLAAFLWAIDRVMSEPEPSRPERTRVLYLSPLRALAVDVDKNLRAPLAGISLAAERLGIEMHVPTVGVRTGDTSAAERRRLVTRPPDIAITTPESLYLMLTSQARETLRWVRWVIVDEIHSVAATKRGTHLALSLERLCELTGKTGRGPQRIGLSATQRPLSEVARFLGGNDSERPDSRQVEITDAGMTKQLDVEVIVGVSDMGDLAAASAGATPNGAVRVDHDDDFAAPPLAMAPSDAASSSDTAAPSIAPSASGTVAPSSSDAASPGTAPVPETHSNSIWPAIHPRLLELVYAHRSTIIFTNARRLAERLASRLNELHLDGLNRAAEAEGTSPPEGAELVRAHHGSLSREQRLGIEDDLKAGRVRAIVATSSLELGIDMGAVDLVIQVASPPSVAAGMQRIGRAGHQVGEPSVGKIFPRHRGDLVEAAVVAQRMGTGEIESIRFPRQPLDVLAQQVVAMVAVNDWSVDDLLAVIRRAAPYEQLSEEVFSSVLDLLAGRYPSEEFRELRPRIVWDRTTGMLRARQGAGRLAVTNAGTIPDRGLYAVFTTDGSRVGELDEEMVYEARVGETFLLGASTWRIAEITFDRVVVTPAPGEPGKMPFWHGDGPGRPLELGRAVGAFVRTIGDELPADLESHLMQLDAQAERAAVMARRSEGSSSRQVPDNGTRSTRAAKAAEPTARLVERLQRENCLDRAAAVNVLRYLEAQRSATGVIPDDRTIVVERFRDEIGDWRICILTPFGARVHAPWGIALQAKFAQRAAGGGPPVADGMGGVELLWSDDGIVLRLPDVWPPDDPDGTGAAPNGSPWDSPGAGGAPVLDATDLALDPDEVRETIVGHLPSTALFASRFREVAGRALLLPRRRPGERVPLWQQRQRSAGLLEVAAKYPSFPMLLETSRECLQEVFDVPALAEVLSDIRSRKIRMVTVDTDGASPMAQSLLFDWISVFMYGGDAPLAERRAAALALDRDLLADLLGAEELRELLDAEVLAELELELQRLADGRRARSADELADVLARVGDLTGEELSYRCEPSAPVPSPHEHSAVESDEAAQAADVVSDSTSAGQAAEGSAAAGESLPVVRSDVLVQAGWLTELLAQRRAVELRVAGEIRYVAVEDAARYRDALGCALPVGLPAALTVDVLTPGAEPLDELVARFAATHVPFEADAVAGRLGIAVARVTAALNRLETAKRLTRGAFRPDGTSTEWCDTSVLRTVRRRSLARLRREVEPVEPAAYARFLAAWHSIDRPRRGADALADAITQLAGAPVAASILETDVLPARLVRYSGADLDGLLASGELVWIGAGSLGPNDGRVQLYWRDEVATLAPPPDDEPDDPVSAAVLAHLHEHGAAFWPDLLAAAAAAPTRREADAGAEAVPAGSSAHGGDETHQLDGTGSDQPDSQAHAAAAPLPPASSADFAARVLTALWDLVWAGLVTNDTLAPLRALGPRTRRAKGKQPGGRRSATTRGRSRVLTRSGPRPRPGRLRVAGSPSAAGRWSLTSLLREPAPSPTERAHGAAQALLERHGIVTRPGVLAESHPGGFAAAYGILRALEERGSVRRGHFTEGLGAAQFATPAAVERLRDYREGSGDVLLLAAADPAQPYGAALAWPPSDGRPSRTAGGHVVLADGVPLVMLDRGGRTLHTFEPAAADLRWIDALRDGLASGRLAKVELGRIDSTDAAEQTMHDLLIENGFTSGYRGPTLRP
ncbi:Lhr family helicase [Candidatus Poriferisodalis sp.]|uniref:Lhr family helicase n=1 Tax=Candidatus Poriferisodalis sp. TaxID=3101277 RepID=UPI003B02E686